MNSLLLPTPEDTQRFAAELAASLKPGDCIALSGEMGTGKTALARAIICALTGKEVEVTSPTYTLAQRYDAAFPIWHLDLCRVEDASELLELGLEDMLPGAVTLIEWPEIARARLPEHTIFLDMGRHGSGAHSVCWRDILPSHAAPVAKVVKSAGYGAAEQHPLKGDASSRRYTRLSQRPRNAMLMSAPPHDVDSRIFVNIARHLRTAGYSAPDVLAEDMAWGLAVLEDLGDDLYTSWLQKNPKDEAMLYDAAVDVLAEWAKHKQLRKNTSELSLPDYSAKELKREVMLFAEWYLPSIGVEGREYTAIWDSLIAKYMPQQNLFVHRDYHADNLLWLPERKGTARVGLLDFQDALWGDAAYDLVSLLEDARRDVPPAIAQREINRYIEGTGENEADFLRRYAFLGAQRNCKIIGIFMRLSRRDGKHHYLQHLPRVWRHLEHDVKHPALLPLKKWLDAHVPAAARENVPEAA